MKEECLWKKNGDMKARMKGRRGGNRIVSIRNRNGIDNEWHRSNM
jgi:hypothetical protein